MDILEMMYNGKFPPFYELNIWNEEYEKLVKRIVEVEAEISKISPEASKLLDDYQEIQSAINTITFYHEFSAGFRVGAQLMLEMLKPLK